MPARRAPDRLACVALHSFAVAIGLCSVRLPRMGMTQQFGGSHGTSTEPARFELAISTPFG
nr:MAG TPA: hypothetical protein [Caudoviricetes sp.]DAU13705.1 MAG TPA: hypothetical protein [Bacteriophage sp.]